jgi:hypothetical protein
MKVFQMSEVDTIVGCNSAEEAIKWMMNELCSDMGPEYTLEDFKEEFCIEVKELDARDHFCYFSKEDDVCLEPGHPDLDKYRISFADLIKNHPEELPMLFSSEW